MLAFSLLEIVPLKNRVCYTDSSQNQTFFLEDTGLYGK